MLAFVTPAIMTSLLLSIYTIPDAYDFFQIFYFYLSQDAIDIVLCTASHVLDVFDSSVVFLQWWLHTDDWPVQIVRNYSLRVQRIYVSLSMVTLADVH